MDHRFHFIKHAVDDAGKLRKRLVDVTVRKPLTQIAGDDALNPLIYLFDPFLSPHAQPRTSQQAQAKRRATDPAPAPDRRHGKFPWFRRPLVRSPACRHSAFAGRSRGSRGCLADRLRPDNREALRQDHPSSAPAGAVPDCLLSCGHPRRTIRHIERRGNPALDARSIASSRRSPGKAAITSSLTGDHSIRSRDQIVIGLPVDEAEQHDDENREHAGHRQCPAKGVRTYDLRLTHRISPRESSCSCRQRRDRHRPPNPMVRCEE